MPVYPFKCSTCGEEVEIIQSIHKTLRSPSCETHGKMEQVICVAGIVFGRTPGRNTGIYALDYGKRATEDLTVPGKLERLKKEGRIKDPFDSVPRNTYAKDQKEIAESMGMA